MQFAFWCLPKVTQSAALEMSQMSEDHYSQLRVHRIIEWLGLERTSSIIKLEPPYHMQGHQPPYLILDQSAQGSEKLLHKIFIESSVSNFPILVSCTEVTAWLLNASNHLWFMKKSSTTASPSQAYFLLYVCLNRLKTIVFTHIFENQYSIHFYSYLYKKWIFQLIPSVKLFMIYAYFL